MSEEFDALNEQETFDVDDIPMPETPDMADVEDDFTKPPAFRFGFVGIGQGGSRIAEMFYKLGYRRICAINTTAKDLVHINIPVKSKLVVQATDNAGAEGAGKNPEIAEEAISSKSEEVYDLLRRCWGEKYDRAFVCLGAGGGTGAGTVAKVVEIATKVMTDLKLGKMQVGIIVALPKNDEGQKVARNALATLKKLQGMKLSPIIIIDNERIRAIYPKTSVNQFWHIANSSVCTLLHLFNQISAQSSQHSTFDPADLGTLLGSGVVAFGATVISKYESQADISKAIRQQLKANVLASVDLSKGKRAGCIFIGSQGILGNIPMEYLDHGYDMINRLLSDGSVVHRGIYTGSKPDLRVYTMIGGLEFPAERIAELSKIAGA